MLVDFYCCFAWKVHMEFAVMPTYPRCSEFEDNFDSWQMISCHARKHNPPSSFPAKFWKGMSSDWQA